MNTRSLVRHLMIAILLGLVFYKSLTGYWTLWLARYQAHFLLFFLISISCSLLLHYTSVQSFLLEKGRHFAQSNRLPLRLFYSWLSCKRCIIFWVILIFGGIFWSIQLPGLLGVLLLSFFMANLISAFQVALFLYL